MELSSAKRDDFVVIWLDSGIFSNPSILDDSLAVDDYDDTISTDITFEATEADKFCIV